MSVRIYNCVDSSLVQVVFCLHVRRSSHSEVILVIFSQCGLIVHNCNESFGSFVLAVSKKQGQI